MKQTIRWLLFDTQAGDLVLRALEHFVGLALVDIAEIEGPTYAATKAGRDRVLAARDGKVEVLR